ncbi:hypothetical protein [Bosea sp. 124]|uniref:hypothetical protein n=1 Tax=Bosea sp. 124 TaxID=2135642 RepID=UPI000D389962|nr:hypothetical protein [Bosea sp. 124]PTM39825.1 hypothetical protein C8D03_1332 [Bosea sp. 124]
MTKAEIHLATARKMFRQTEPALLGFDLFHFTPANLLRLKMTEKLEEARDLDPDYSMPVSDAIDALWQTVRRQMV